MILQPRQKPPIRSIFQLLPLFFLVFPPNVLGLGLSFVRSSSSNSIQFDFPSHLIVVYLWFSFVDESWTTRL